MNQKTLLRPHLRLPDRPFFEVSVLAIALLAVSAILTAQGCGRFRALFHRADVCSLDERPIHQEMKVRVLIEGRKEATDGCCIRCAINYAKQSGTMVRVLSITDYATHRPIPPDRALYVTGSDFSPCAVSEAAVTVSGGRREVASSEWDRCIPSSVAFANTNEAREFQKQHGGTIQNWKELVGLNSLVPG